MRAICDSRDIYSGKLIEELIRCVEFAEKRCSAGASPVFSAAAPSAMAQDRSGSLLVAGVAWMATGAIASEDANYSPFCTSGRRASRSHARNLFCQTDRQFPLGKSGRSPAGPRNTIVSLRRWRALLLCDDLYSATFQRHRVRLSNPGRKAAKRSADRDEPRIAASRSFPARSGAHRCSRASNGTRVSPGESVAKA